MCGVATGHANGRSKGGSVSGVVLRCECGRVIEWPGIANYSGKRACSTLLAFPVLQVGTRRVCGLFVVRHLVGGLTRSRWVFRSEDPWSGRPHCWNRPEIDNNVISDDVVSVGDLRRSEYVVNLDACNVAKVTKLGLCPVTSRTQSILYCPGTRRSRNSCKATLRFHHRTFVASLPTRC
jgi:hypothetical protein